MNNNEANKCTLFALVRGCAYVCVSTLANTIYMEAVISEEVGG